MSFVSGQILLTAPNVTNVPGGAFKIFAAPDGKVISIEKPSTFVGQMVKTQGNWAQIRLRKAPTGYTYGWIETARLRAWTSPNTYYIAMGRTGVNVRNAPSLTSTVIKKLNSGQNVGKSDGYQENGFVLIALNGGGIGWVSADYVTSNKSTPDKSTPDTTTGTAVDEPIDSELNLVQKYAGPAVIFLTCILLITLARYAFKYKK